jgi:hypothetical protein
MRVLSLWMRDENSTRVCMHRVSSSFGLSSTLPSCVWHWLTSVFQEFVVRVMTADTLPFFHGGGGVFPLCILMLRQPGIGLRFRAPQAMSLKDAAAQFGRVVPLAPLPMVLVLKRRTKFTLMTPCADTELVTGFGSLVVPAVPNMFCPLRGFRATRTGPLLLAVVFLLVLPFVFRVQCSTLFVVAPHASPNTQAGALFRIVPFREGMLCSLLVTDLWTAVAFSDLSAISGRLVKPI